MYIETEMQDGEMDTMFRALVIATIVFAFTTFITILIIVVICL